MRLPAVGVGHVSQRVCLFARCWRRPMYGVVSLFVTIATAAAAALVCLFVCYVDCGDGFVHCLGGRPIRLARHGTADDDGRDPPVCVWRRVSGGFGGRPLGRAQGVRSCLYVAVWLAGVCVLGGLPDASCRWLGRW